MVKVLLEISRPKQWIKNFFVFTGIFFSLSFNNISVVADSVIVFFAFILASSSVYVINDLMDRNKDKFHPVKKSRPLPSGRLDIRIACAYSLMLATGSLYSAWQVSATATAIISAYILMNIFYSIHLKSVVILDVIIISLGFLFRIFSGTYGLNLEPSSWLILCALSLTLFLGLNKRYSEFMAVGSDKTVRPVLQKYDRKFLEHGISITCAMTLVSYALYTLDETTMIRHQSEHLFLTFLPVFYCVLRYQLIVEKGKSGQDPSSVVVSDMGLFWGAFTWLVLFLFLKFSPI